MIPTPNPGSTTQRPAEKSIGDIIRDANNLSPEQVEEVLAYQREHGVKFGEAAVALGLVKREDVLWALSQQFHYPYSPSTAEQKISEELVAASHPFSESAEAFRDLRSQLISSVFAAEGKKKAAAIISAATGDGKSYLAANLAVAFSQLGGRTLLVDADMRSPRLHELFNIKSKVGLSGILSGRSASNVIRPVPDLPSLFLLPVGVTPPNPLELVQRPAFGLFMKELLNKFDYVIVDTPAASAGSDARVIAAACGAAVVVARRDTSRTDDMKKLIASVKKSSVTIVGVAVNEF